MQQALSIVQRLSDELGIISPKYTALLRKLKNEIEVGFSIFSTSTHPLQQKFAEDRTRLESREKQLLNLIVELNQRDDPFCQQVLRLQEEIYNRVDKMSKLQASSQFR